MPSDATQTSTPCSTPSPQNSKETEVDKSAKQVHEPIAPFLNRLRSNNNVQIEKILEIFNQVKVNVPLLDTINKSLVIPNSLRTCAPKRETNVPDKVF